MPTTANIHTEAVLEEYIANCLVREQGYELRECAPHYDRARAMDTGLLLRFITSTQPDAWARLQQEYGSDAEDALLKQVQVAQKESGTHGALRNEFKVVPNIPFKLCHFKPASGINEDLESQFQQNILSVMRQVKYSVHNEKCIDLVLFVNGIPVATIELKNPLTKQDYKNAETQYKEDRAPAGEPLLTFKRGAIVHFTVDTDVVSMTTRLQQNNTRFLPFNRGRNGGAGNAAIAGDYPIAYLYKDWSDTQKAIFSRDVWLDIIGGFIHLERKSNNEKLIFPRFQQLDAVHKILADARTHGAGQHYLIQHSAGSGKSNTIAWTAHRLSNLHTDDDKSVFDSVIIVTDRLVLDRQLQETVSQFSEVAGVVKNIDGTSKDLRDAIKAGARIIITTIQKFGTTYLQTISGQAKKKFAVIIDEAHSSQSGKAAGAMTDTLTRDNASAPPKDIETIILEHQRARGPQPNISFLAFTATPRNVTLERFGRDDAEGKPQAFHLYSMRQAIEEGFILDVLQNYATYKPYYHLEKAIADDPLFKERKGQRKIARYVSLHDDAIAEKAAVIIEHFRRHVAKEIEGRAKAMVVCQSREQAVRYWLQLKQYLANNRIANLGVLVAFSDELKVDDVDYTEAGANGFSDTELPRQFDGEKYQILVVAEKYQTGFDQPKLCAMYVDKKLAGLQAVQTLSRLNRTYPKKSKTFILDFKNTIDEIKEAFKPYFEATTLEARTNRNQIYTLESRVMHAAWCVQKSDVERFAQTFFKTADKLSTDDRKQLELLVREAVHRFVADDDEKRKEEFRQLVKSYIRFYIFVAQIDMLNDTWLEKLCIYLSWLDRLLPARAGDDGQEITDDMLSLKAFRLNLTEQSTGTLQEGDSKPLPPIDKFGANPPAEDEEESLSQIISAFNQHHNTDFSREDFLQINRELLQGDMADKLRSNPADVVRDTYSKAFYSKVLTLLQQNNEMESILTKDKYFREQFIAHFFNRALRDATSNAG